MDFSEKVTECWQKYSSWDWISTIGNVKLIRSSGLALVVIPLFVKIFQGVSGEYKIEGIEPTLTINLELPFNWIALYFAAISMTIADLIYICQCPLIIKEFKDYGQFRSKAINFLSLPKIASDSGLDIKIIETVSVAYDMIELRQYKEGELLISVADTNLENKERDFFEITRQFSENIRSKSRLTTLFFYIVSLILLFGLSLQSVGVTLKFIYNYLYSKSAIWIIYKHIIYTA